MRSSYVLSTPCRPTTLARAFQCRVAVVSGLPICHGINSVRGDMGRLVKDLHVTSLYRSAGGITTRSPMQPVIRRAIHTFTPVRYAATRCKLPACCVYEVILKTRRIGGKCCRCSGKPQADPAPQSNTALSTSGSALGRFIQLRLFSLPIWLALSTSLVLKFVSK